MATTVAVLDARLNELQARINRIHDEQTIQFRELRLSNEKHQQSDKEEFDDVGARIDAIKESIGELKTMLAERIAVQEDVDQLREYVDSLRLSREGNKPWMEILVKIIWALIGAGIAWLIHGSLPLGD